MCYTRSAKEKGVVAITTILGLALIIAVIGVAMGVISLFESSIAFSQIKSQEAYLMAQSGVHDALLRLARDKSYLAVAPGYTLANGANAATITVTSPSSGKKQIISLGVASKRRHQLVVDVAVDDLTGLVTILSWREVSL